MSTQPAAAPVTGEVFDLGYQRYEGVREGRWRSRRAVWRDAVEDHKTITAAQAGNSYVFAFDFAVCTGRNVYTHQFPDAILAKGAYQFVA